MDESQGLDILLELDGVIIAQDGGYWVKFEAKRVPVSENIPHGIRYNLTLHDNCNQRVMGYDNAHAHKAKGGRRGKYKAEIVTYDHKHRTRKCKGEPYSFNSPVQLI
jgi:hypothetical protein